MKKVGLVLSGGGTRGFAHLGLLKVLDELNIKPFAISAVSIGAILGALYASGKKPDEILELSKKNSFFSFSNLLWRKEGLFSMEPIKKLLTEQIVEDSFESLQISFFISVTDFTDNKLISFSSGELIKWIIASASVPVLFSPVIHENRLMVDGGLLNNLPVEPLTGLCDTIIGMHVNKIEVKPGSTMKLSKLAITERCFHMSIANSVYSRAKHCDLFFEPALDSFGMFDVKHADKIFEIGYNTALKQKDQLIKMLT
ncbi:MAG: patatin-like phospholipase family protein [Bacteroidota bacterium]|jgi:NTE family protein|nr:patatin-like phospholipase family protein [Bacteroidota bacterium]